MKVLHLTLTKKWFDLIAKGTKKQEYRDYRKYYHQRLLDENRLIIQYEEVIFRNGYNKNCPYMRVECLGIMADFKRNHKPLNGEVLPDEFYIISLGEILEIKNWEEDK